MPAEPNCPRCGTALSPDALEGLCPTCVGRAAFDNLCAIPHDTAGVPAAQALEEQFARLKPEEAGERIGPYKLMEQIGQGGFGTVWVADQERPVRRRVALKIIKLGMDTKEVIARFEQERQALAMMEHPHIAKVFDAGATQWGRPFFVMELVRGIKITDYCDQANLPTANRLALFIQVCNAVQHAHQKGIIHRDLKPSNILVTLHDGVPVPKVIGIGVAKATQQQRLTDLTIYTQFQQMIGTPLYMSPEQAEMSGLDIDTRSDIYSLGVLLYELLTGRTPFDPEELMKQGLDEIRRVIREQEPQTPSMFLKTMADANRASVAQRRQSDPAKLTNLLRGDLDWIVMKALEKDRARRYETAVSLARDIERHLTSEPVHARPASQFYRFRRFAKRNRLAFSAATAVAFALMAALSVSTWLFVRERKARAAEQIERSRADQEAGRANREAASAHEAAAARASALLSRELAYVVHIQAAQFLLEAKQYTRVAEMLQLDVPSPVEEDYRGIEWRYLWRCAHQDLGGAEGQIARVQDDTVPSASPEWSLAPQEFILGLSTDGATLWTATESGQAHQWKVSDGKLARNSQIPAFAKKDRVVILGDEILSGTSNGELRTTNLTSGDVSRTLHVATAAVFPIKVFSDRRFVAVIVQRGALLMWNLQTNREVTSISDFDAAVKGIEEKIALSSDGELLAYVRKGNSIRVGTKLPGAPHFVFGNDVSAISSLAFSPDRSFLASGTVAGRLRLFNLPYFHDKTLISPKYRLAEPQTLSGHTGPIANVQFSPDGRTLVSAGTDGVRFWSVATGQQLLTFANFSSILVSTDGNVMALYRTQQSQDRVRVMQLPTLKEIDARKWRVPLPIKTPGVIETPALKASITG